MPSAVPEESSETMGSKSTHDKTGTTMVNGKSSNTVEKDSPEEKNKEKKLVNGESAESMEENSPEDTDKEKKSTPKIRASKLEYKTVNQMYRALCDDMSKVANPCRIQLGSQIVRPQTRGAIGKDRR